MKKPRENLSEFFAAFAQYDHNDLNAVYQGYGRTYNIPVRLEHKGKKVAEGTVELLPVRARMECAAVYVFENVLNSHGMDVDWDKAIAGRSFDGEETTTIDPWNLSGHDEFAPEISRYDRALSLTENMARISKSYNSWAEQGHEPPSAYKRGVDLAAAVIAHTAVVKSADLEKFLFYKEAKFGSFFMGFRPRGLEF